MSRHGKTIGRPSSNFQFSSFAPTFGPSSTMAGNIKSSLSGNTRAVAPATLKTTKMAIALGSSQVAQPSRYLRIIQFKYHVNARKRIIQRNYHGFLCNPNRRRNGLGVANLSRNKFQCHSSVTAHSAWT